MATILALAGCWSSGLPAELPVPLPDGTEIVASAMTGAPYLATREEGLIETTQSPPAQTGRIGRKHVSDE
jgi:hypothetical protein